ncbi:MAG: hypothetical protein OEN49_09420, partial [Gammaproteobacteria bacterium]|nr:hypothetical protein [Gammaproteobacteria bacterium]
MLQGSFCSFGLGNQEKLAELDTRRVKVSVEQEPGSGGKESARSGPFAPDIPLFDDVQLPDVLDSPVRK